MYGLEINAYRNGNGDPIVVESQQLKSFSKYLAEPCFQLYTSLGLLLDELL